MFESLITLEEALATARAEIGALAPDPATAADGEAYLMRQLTVSLSDAFLAHLFTEGGLTRPLPTKGGPNPDYLMSHARIDPDRTYRIEGALNDSERIGLGLYSFGGDGAALLEGYAAFDRKAMNTDGRFSLDLAAGTSGSGALAITPGSRVLIVRTLHRAADGQPARLTLTGGDSTKLASAVDAAGAQAQAAQALLRGVRQFLQWTRLISAHPNQFIMPPPSIANAVQGDPDTCYGFGYYDLADGEWLDALIPDGVRGYWSLHAYNLWLESLPGTGVSDANAVPDADGRIRVRIGSGASPGLANPIDTQQRRRGILIYRSIGSASQAIPRATLLQ